MKALVRSEQLEVRISKEKEADCGHQVDDKCNLFGDFVVGFGLLKIVSTDLPTNMRARCLAESESKLEENLSHLEDNCLSCLFLHSNETHNDAHYLVDPPFKTDHESCRPSQFEVLPQVVECLPSGQCYRWPDVLKVI